MEYIGTIYRPPSEANSLLIQATVGCSWNRCTFCDMYKDKSFYVRKMEEIAKDLKECARYRGHIRRIFLCDGDALALSTDKLTDILTLIQELYPDLEAVRSYASAKDVLRKSPEELKMLRQLGLEMVYIGLESGSDKVLKDVNKGITKQQMIDAAKLLHQAGIKQSISIIAGLGGQEGWEEHILETADALNQMQPAYVGLLVLYVGNDAALFRHIQEGSFRLPSPEQVLKEMRLLVEKLEQEDCYFTSAHASNYVTIRGQLPQEKEKLLKLIDKVSSGNYF